MQPQVSESNIVALIHFADKYQIDPLYKWSKKWLDSSITQANFCKIFADSILLNQRDGTAVCHRFMTSDDKFDLHSIGVLKSKGFCGMGRKAMRQFVQRYGWSLDQQEVWDQLVKWSSFKEDSDVIELMDRDEYRSNRLLGISGLIQSGRMSRDYFSKNLLCSTVLSKGQINEALLHRNCCRASNGKIYFQEPLKYELKMSSKYPGPPNTYEALINDDANQRCGTLKTRLQWICAEFSSKMHVYEMEIWRPGLDMPGGWCSRQIDAATVEYSLDGKSWSTVAALSASWDPADRIFAAFIAKYVRIIKRKKGWLGLGKWKLFGFSALDSLHER